MKLAALLCLLSLGCQAQEVSDQARTAAIADGASSALAIGLGGVEVNPLGPVLSLGLKALVLKRAESLPEAERAVFHAQAASVWSGAAANNICVAAALASGGAFAPACILIGIAWGVRTWRQTEHERIFWTEGCPMLRLYVGDPELVCVYTAPSK